MAILFNNLQLPRKYATTLFCFGLLLLYFVKREFISEDEYHHTAQTPILKRKQSSDVVLLGYLKGRSTIIANVLGMKSNRFYIYEPLYVQGSDKYFKPGYFCNIFDGKCKAYKMSKKIQDILYFLHRCDFFSVQNDVNVWSFSLNRSSNDHIRLNKLEEDELMSPKNLEYICDSSKAKVSKVLRVSMGTLKWLMDMLPDLKIIHLISDPRAIMHARRITWKKETSDIFKAANALCVKMEDDTRQSVDFQQKYPNRIITVYFEDIIEDPIRHFKALFDKLFWEFTIEDAKRAKSFISDDLNDKNGRNRWRYKMSHVDVYQVNKACKNVYNKHRYPAFKTEQEMKNEKIFSRIHD